MFLVGIDLVSFASVSVLALDRSQGTKILNLKPAWFWVLGPEAGRKWKIRLADLDRQGFAAKQAKLFADDLPGQGSEADVTLSACTEGLVALEAVRDFVPV